jgi:alpha-beta hydrolase superfamily lysophospholipase
VAATLRRPELVDGLSLLYPGIHARIGPGLLDRLKLWLAGCLGVRARRVPIPLDDPALFTRDAEWQEFIREDPLALHEVTVSFLLASQELERLCEAAPSRLQCPLLMMLAGADEIVDNNATRRWFSACASTRKECREYPDARHTLEFEPDRDVHIGDLVEWMQHVDASG